MSLFAFIGVTTLVAGCCYAQSSSTTTTASVPTGTPVPGDYNSALRPQIHFSPPVGFMNDPNGLHRDADGLWHLYFQYNPTATVAGNQHWGHATSMDLYHWENQQIALFPPTPTDYVFSGSAIIDSNNTSGFFPNQTNGVVAIYTLSGTLQTQNIAYSADGGYTFTPYASNPIIDINSTEFRDPKVIWYTPTQRWVMVVAYSQEFTVGIFTSPNLRDWIHASNFSHAGFLGGQYECPNMVSMPMYEAGADPSTSSPSSIMYLMEISINPGAPLGGSVTQYFPGAFNGTHFTPVDEATRLTDFAKDNYAGQFFFGPADNEPQVSIGWASNWQYTDVVPTGELEGWRSAMSLPRLNYLTKSTRVGYTLVSQPYNLTSLLIPSPTTPLAQNTSLGNGTLLVDFSPSIVPSSSIYLSINITNIPSNTTVGTVNVTLLSSLTGESISMGQLPLGGDLFLSRSNTYGFDNPFFTDKFSTTNLIDPTTNNFLLEGVYDRSIFELFCRGGESVGTMVVYPEQLLDTLIIKTGDLNPGVAVEAKVWGLRSTWAQYEDESGIVVGNTTKTANGTVDQRVRRDGLGDLVMEW